MRQRSEKHLDTDQKLLQSCRYIIHIICGPLLQQCAESDIYQSHHISSSQLGHIGAPPKHVQHADYCKQTSEGEASGASAAPRQGRRHTPVLSTPLQDRIAIATPCQYVRKTTALTHKNLDTGRMGASSYFVPLIEQNQAIQCPCLQMADPRLSVHPCPLLKLIAQYPTRISSGGQDSHRECCPSSSKQFNPDMLF